VSVRRRRVDNAELLDDPAAVQSDLAANLADIRRLNSWFGGTELILDYVRPLLRRHDVSSLLDVATGSADIPVAIHRWAEEEGLRVHIEAADISTEVLSQAEKLVTGTPVRLKCADARDLPWADASVDVVTCCLSLHHFPPAEARRVLAELWRVARVAVVATDLTRGLVAYAAAILATRTVARNRMTRHDGPLSVLRAYTRAELQDLAMDAGLRDARVRRHPFFRQALVAHKGVTSDA